MSCQRNKSSTDVLTGHLFTSEGKQHQKSQPTFAILLLKYVKYVNCIQDKLIPILLLLHSLSPANTLWSGRDKETTESEPGASKQKPVRTLINVGLKVKLPESKTSAAKWLTDPSDRLQQSSCVLQRVWQNSACFTLCPQGKTFFFCLSWQAA